jgi:dUTP pyrophosphatase
MESKKITIKVIRKGALAALPKQMHVGDAGFDLVANSRKVDLVNECMIYSTGLRVEIPKGYAMFIFPRSSCYKHAAMMANCASVIDSGYRGEVHVVFKGIEGPYKLGDRIAQAVILPVPEVEYVDACELSESDRGEGGLGSTGV